MGGVLGWGMVVVVVGGGEVVLQLQVHLALVCIAGPAAVLGGAC